MEPKTNLGASPPCWPDFTTSAQATLSGNGRSVSTHSGPHNLHADMYIKYDPRTRNGYALRMWRTTQSADKCMFQLYKIENGAGSPLNDRQVLSGVFKTTTHLTLKVTGTTDRKSTR